MRVAVTGAGGFIGTHFVEAVVKRADTTVAIVRNAIAAERLRAQRATVVVTELDDRRALAAALAGCDAVVHLAGGGSTDAATAWAANAESTEHVVGACRRAGIDRLLLASTVSVTRNRLGAYGASKRAAEEQALASELDVTVFRLAFVYGRGTTGVFARLVEVVRRLPVVPVVGSGQLDIGPVYVGDVVDAMLAALDRPDLATGKTYTLAGPPATFDEVVEGVLARLGLRKRTIHLPGSLALGIARALAFLPQPPITRDNVLGMTQVADHDSSLARRELGFSPRPLSEGLDLTLR